MSERDYNSYEGSSDNGDGFDFDLATIYPLRGLEADIVIGIVEQDAVSDVLNHPVYQTPGSPRQQRLAAILRHIEGRLNAEDPEKRATKENVIGGIRYGEFLIDINHGFDPYDQTWQYVEEE